MHRQYLVLQLAPVSQPLRCPPPYPIAPLSPRSRRWPLQAFERQVDSLSRQLSQAEADGEELVRQREGLLEEIRAAQQVGGSVLLTAG